MAGYVRMTHLLIPRDFHKPIQPILFSFISLYATYFAHLVCQFLRVKSVVSRVLVRFEAINLIISVSSCQGLLFDITSYKIKLKTTTNVLHLFRITRKRYTYGY